MSRSSAWSDAEVTALISIWENADIQEQLDGATRNKTIFETISKELQENEYDKDWQQCRAKIENLKENIKRSKTTMVSQEMGERVSLTSCISSNNLG